MKVTVTRTEEVEIDLDKVIAFGTKDGILTVGTLDGATGERAQHSVTTMSLDDFVLTLARRFCGQNQATQIDLSNKRPRTKLCPSCVGDGYHSEPITHPTNPTLDSWERRTCTTCNGGGTIA